MPYSKLDERPEAVKTLPKRGQEIWMAAFNSAFEQYKGDEEKSFATAWAAVKDKYRKEDGKWVPFGDGEPWIEVFSTGWHTDSEGRKNFWTEADLKEMATLYNPKHHRAPITIGHPEDDAPAYGWIAAAKVKEKKLLLMPEQVDPWLKEEVRKGHYKNVSIGIYPDLGLRHLGFLGAVPPAVKGLQPVTFAEKAAWEITYTPSPLAGEGGGEGKFSEADKAVQEARSKKYNIAIKDGGHVTKPGEWSGVPDDEFLDPVNYRYSCPDADQTRAAAAYWGKPDNQAQYSTEERAIINKRLDEREKQFKIGQHSDVTQGFSPDNKTKGGTHMKEFFEKLLALITGAQKQFAEGDGQVPVAPALRFTEAEVQAREAKVKAEAEKIVFAEVEKLKKEKTEAEAKVKEIEIQKRKDGIAAFCEAQCKEGKLTPALRKIIEPLMIFAATHEEPIEFAEGKKEKPVEIVKLFLKELPKMVEFKEIVKRDGPGGQPSKFMEYVEQVQKEKKISKSEAISLVAKEKPDLHQEWIQEVNPDRNLADKGFKS